MALRGPNKRSGVSSGVKDIKKSSYYVWFLGAQEAKGLRGEEYVKPIVRHLIQKERDVEPFKVTLQISHKGLKIIQNVTSTAGVKNSSSTTNGDIVKHFIPHHAVTCVVQESSPNDDIVSCILLIYNPITRCPVHVHCYRCDSVETAAILRSQLQTLIDRPDNQKKFGEIESRLQAKGLLSSGRRLPAGGSDGRSSSTRESESSGSSDRGGERIATLYDSLAAELREKLHGIRGPLLLPPRDYDTVHRQRGNLTGIELRRCRNANIVGTEQSPPGSSGGSSGIGSDDAPPSPAEHHLHHLHAPRVAKIEPMTRGHHHHQVVPDPRSQEPPRDVPKTQRYIVEDRTSSDEDDEWRDGPAIQPHHRHAPPSWAPQRVAVPPNSPPHDLSLPRPRRVPSFAEAPGELTRRRSRDPEHRQRSPSPMSPRERFRDAKEKFHALERERLDELQGQLERRRQETAAANVAAAITGNVNVTRRSAPRRSTSEDELRAGGRYRAIPTRTVNNNSDVDEFDEPPQPVQTRSRRSMYENVEEERRRNSHELAKEFKRKSYHSPGFQEIAANDRKSHHPQGYQDLVAHDRKSHHPPGYQELAAHERYPGLDKESARLQHHYVHETNNARYRHSYAEPEVMGQQYYKQQHRRLGPSHSNAGSSITSSARLGIAALHPY